MNRKDYGPSVVVIRVLEKKLLSKMKIDRMIDADTPEEAFKQLGETEYSQSMSDINDFHEYEKVLKREIERVFNLVRELTKDKEIVDILSLKYDYHNLKVLLKGRLSKTDLTHLLMDAGVEKVEKLKLKFDIKDYRDLPDEFTNAISEVEKVFSETGDTQLIDIIVDKYYYKHLLKIAKKINIKIILDYVEGLIDFQNIVTLFRSKKQNRDIKFLEEIINEGGTVSKEKIILSINDTPEMILNKFRREKIGTYLEKAFDDYIVTKRLSELEKTSQNYLLNLTLDSKYVVFGPEPLFAYLMRKEREISAIRMIMVGKINNIDSHKIKERLGDIYV